MIGDDMIGVSFQGFFSNDIKEGVRAVQGARYDGNNKIWLLPKSKQEELIQNVGSLCLDHEIKIFDVPDFVYDFQER